MTTMTTQGGTTRVDAVLDGAVSLADARAMIPRDLSPDERSVVERVPPSLRYVLFARRFGVELPVDVEHHDDLHALATALAARAVDPFDLADLDAWWSEQRAASHRWSDG